MVTALRGGLFLTLLALSAVELHASFNALTQCNSREQACDPDALEGLHLMQLGVHLQHDKMAVTPRPAHAVKGFHAFLRAFTVISVAGTFDNTWFLTCVLALRFGGKAAFVGAMAALSVHAILCAALGFVLTSYVRLSTLGFIAAGLFSVFGCIYAREACLVDADANFMAASKEEAEEHFNEEEESAQGAAAHNLHTGDAAGGPVSLKSGAPLSPAEGRLTSQTGGARSFLVGMSTCFLIILVGEMGDRSQIAMVGLDSSLPMVPTTIGCWSGFFISAMTSVLAASIVEKQNISQRAILCVASLSFAISAAWSVYEAILSKAAGQ